MKYTLTVLLAMCIVSCGSQCEEVELSRTTSNNGSIATVSQSDCGATGPAVAVVRIVTPSTTFLERRGNKNVVFWSDGTPMVRVSWQDDHHLSVSCSRGGEHQGSKNYGPVEVVAVSE